MGPGTEHEHPPKPRKSKALSLRDVPCDAGRGEDKGWVLMGGSLRAKETWKSPRRVNGLHWSTRAVVPDPAKGFALHDALNSEEAPVGNPSS